MSTIAIVAALDRELNPFVNHWDTRFFHHGGQSFRARESGPMVAIAGGIGPEAARTTARALVAQYHPRVLISAGVAGATNDDLAVGTIIMPRIVIDAATGIEYRSDFGNGSLVTSPEIADSKSKHELGERFHASAVDMEAAAVAEVAQQERIGFRCVKAISDQASFVMPPLYRFVDEKGQFGTVRFAIWAALRPLHWPAVIALARNTKHAAESLGSCLKDMTSRGLEMVKEMPGKTTKVLDV